MVLKKYWTTVLENRQVTPTTHVIRLEFDGSVPFDFKAGQYIFIHLKKDGKPNQKAYSISSPPSQKDFIEFIIKRVEGGYFSNYLTSAKPEEKIEISGPLGAFTLKEPIKNDVVFVAVGSGLSSISSMLQRAFETGTKKKIWLFFGNRFENEIINKETIEEWVKKYPNFKYVPVISRPSPQWKGETGHVEQILEKYIKKPKNMEIYICGLVQMVEEVKTLAAKIGFDSKKIYFEKYT